MRRRGRKDTLFVLALLFTLAFTGTGASGAALLDPSFGSGGVATPSLPPEASQAEASVVGLAVAAGGTTVAALGGIGELGYFGASRLTPSGAPDPTFGQSGFTPPLAVPQRWSGFNQEAQAEAVASQADGRVVVAGFLQEGLHRPTTFTTLLARYQPDGSPDPGFGSGGIVLGPRHFGPGGTVFHAVAVASDGRIIAVGGRNESRRGTERPAGVVYAFNPNGSLDKSFGRRGRVLFSQRARKTYTSLRDVDVLGSGKILVLGYRNYRLFLARLHANGRLDRGFGGGDGMVTLDVHDDGTCCPPDSLGVQADGRIVAAANGGPFHKARVYLVRFRRNGSLDRGFGRGGIAAPYLPRRLFSAIDVAVQGDGGILTVGRSAKTKQNADGGLYAVFRNLPDGAVDRSFGDRGLEIFQYGDLGYPGAALTQPGGGVLVGGSFATAGQGDGKDVTTLLLVRFLS